MVVDALQLTVGDLLGLTLLMLLVMLLLVMLLLLVMFFMGKAMMMTAVSMKLCVHWLR